MTNCNAHQVAGALLQGDIYPAQGIPRDWISILEQL
jgi:hypothetical protein